MGTQHHGVVFCAPPGARPVNQQVSDLVRRHFDAGVGQAGAEHLHHLLFLRMKTVDAAEHQKRFKQAVGSNHDRELHRSMPDGQPRRRS